jgi:hypothetical protein
LLETIDNSYANTGLTLQDVCALTCGCRKNREFICDVSVNYQMILDEE